MPLWHLPNPSKPPRATYLPSSSASFSLFCLSTGAPSPLTLSLSHRIAVGRFLIQSSQLTIGCWHILHLCCTLLYHHVSLLSRCWDRVQSGNPLKTLNWQLAADTFSEDRSRSFSISRPRKSHRQADTFSTIFSFHPFHHSFIFCSADVLILGQKFYFVSKNGCSFRSCSGCQKHSCLD